MLSEYWAIEDQTELTKSGCGSLSFSHTSCKSDPNSGVCGYVCRAVAGVNLWFLLKTRGNSHFLRECCFWAGLRWEPEGELLDVEVCSLNFICTVFRLLHVSGKEEKTRSQWLWRKAYRFVWSIHVLWMLSSRAWRNVDSILTVRVIPR